MSRNSQIKQSMKNGYFRTIVTMTTPVVFFYETPFSLYWLEDDPNIHISIDREGEIVIEYPDGTESNHLPTSYDNSFSYELSDWTIDSEEYVLRSKGSSNVQP